MLAASVFAASPAHKGNPNPGIIPPNAHFHGMTYGEWLAGFNQWVFSLPAADNPIFEGNEDKIAIGQPKHVWFLANAAPVVNRHFTVPAGTALYATIFAVEWDNQICVDPDTNYTVDELRAIAKSIVDSFTDIEVQVDGVPVEDIAAYRSTSPVFFSTTVEQICEAVHGTYGPMVADGYALLLAPLSVGEHTIHISGVVVVDPSDPSKDVDVDVTWHITVAPHSK
jgi:hypothetical protein